MTITFPMINVTLRRLEVFLAVAEAESFSRAADKLDIAQPSVSAHIRSLEHQVGGAVFRRRRGSRPVLTDLGRSVRDHARELLAEADDLRADIVSLRTSAGTELVLSCQRSLANFVLKEPITRFALTHREIRLIVRIGKQEDVVEEVRDGIADIGCFLSNEEMRGVHSEVIGAQRLQIVAGSGHPLVGRRKVKPGEVARYGFVGPPPGTLFGRAVQRLLKSAGINDIQVVAQATEYQFLRELVAAGVGLSCSPEKSVEADVAAGLLSIIDLDAPDLVFQIRLISSQRRPRSAPMEEFSTYLRSCMPTL
ncbi:LysR family transcriptional regulator [Chelativorans sp. AA-79]|uniref:LysR family transcriptional regulator n=1 Tax=Chelativorans sp. AA-79 TaxID=3028735 RepID=UPI0023F8BD10|nr:LysR family transcriptional regulator [Chelativorans sp. AA-79]WEX10775.1 LysR family transcriptional regulator [Chelativorans sp. AA-79]